MTLLGAPPLEPLQVSPWPPWPSGPPPPSSRRLQGHVLLSSYSLCQPSRSNSIMYRNFTAHTLFKIHSRHFLTAMLLTHCYTPYLKLYRSPSTCIARRSEA